MNLVKTSFAIAALAAAMPASAAIFVIDFEGVGDDTPVGDYYNGGGGTNHGVSFSPATLALVDADAGGTGNFANEPSGDTVMTFADADNAILNMAAGFTTGFSFFYSSDVATSVTVYDGLNATGNVLGTLDLARQANDNGCVGDPTGAFCNWTSVGVSFDGTAMSIDFGAVANRAAFDNITFGSPIAAIPEPETYALMLAGLGMVAFMARRRRT